MKRIFLLLIACCFLSTISAQSTRKIRELEAKRKELHQQIAESETLLQSTKKDVKSQLDNLALLTGQIEERRKYINTIESDVHTLTSVSNPRLLRYRTPKTRPLSVIISVTRVS